LYQNEHLQELPEYHFIEYFLSIWVSWVRTRTVIDWSSLFVILQTRTTAMYSCLVAVDDIDEGRLQAGAADEEAVNVGLLGKLAAVLLRHAASVQDPSLLGRLRRDLLLEPLANGGMNFLCLLGGRYLASTNGPSHI
jgi:hypothetical protein